ncbi:MAG: histidine phosphotransferase family protein, partial [Alphaproteobacteria bacterium]
NLGELIITRISHDLAGICGALYNTAELLELDKTFADEAGALMKQTTASLNARLKLFRAVFGLKTKEIENIIVTDYFKTLSAPFSLNGTVENALHLGAVLVCCDVMIRGGTIRIEPQAVIGEGPVKADAALAAVLRGEQTDSPKLAPAAWLADTCRAQGYPLTVDISDNAIRLQLG